MRKISKTNCDRIKKKMIANNDFEFGFLSNEQKIRFVLSNHELYRDVEKLKEIFKAWEIDPCSVNVAFEEWWVSNNWWDDTEFLKSLRLIGVNLDRHIVVKNIVDLSNSTQ